MERESQVQEVKSKIDIVSLVGGYVALKKAGRNYKGLCPFHSEKTGSFMVSAERQIFKCFGCNEGGDAITFYQKIEGVEFPQALKALADKVGVKIRDYQPSPAESQREIFTKINSTVAEFYHFILTKHAAGKKALDYLKERGLNGSSIETWQLGFAPDSWDTAYKYLLKKKFLPKDIIASGLALASTGRGAYDRFRKRIIFPVSNSSGTIVAFSARIFGDGEPKYLNSPDTILFNKSNNLYGLDKAKIEIKKQNQAVLVEGNLDVISSHQAGVNTVVAPLGTALTDKQVEQLRRFTDEVVVSFDQDSAGYAASLRAVELAEQAGLTLKLTEITGKDPDELIKKNPGDWKKAIKESVPVYDFLINNLISRYNLDNPGSFRKITKELKPYFSRIDNQITRSHYERLLATKLGVSEESVRAELFAISESSPTSAKTEQELPRSSEQLKLETYLMELILQGGGLPETFTSTQLQTKQFRTILELVEKKSNGGRFSIKEIKVPEELEEIFDKLTLAEIPANILTSQSKIEEEIETCTLRLKELNLRTELKKASLDLKQAEMSSQEDKVAALTQTFQDLSKQLAAIEKQKELI